MATDHDDERIREIVERVTPPPSPGLRRRALRAAMTALRQRPRRPDIETLVILLVLAGLCVAVLWVALR